MDGGREMAARLHSAATRLLRLLRREDDAGGLSGPRLSALSVIVHAGPLSLAELAAAEQVRPPTMSRLVEALVEAGLATRTPRPGDRRAVSIAASEEGRRLLAAGRDRRVAALSARIDGLDDSDRRALARGIDLIERLSR